MKTIESREDVSELVHLFYAQIRKDNFLGPIFNGMIQEERWPEHLEKLTDFWETNLFGIPKFKGNPVVAHLKTDAMVQERFKDLIDQRHFEHWLALWERTVNENFVGERAERAVQAAKRMSVGQQLALLRFR
jgi:hemoglobin